MKPINGLRGIFVLMAALYTELPALASEQIIPPGGMRCEADWINRSNFETLASIELLQYYERQAERGQVAAQLRLGLVINTRDGKWRVPEDRSYNVNWLEKAIARGSKSAAWELSRIRFREITHEAYLRAAIDAAEHEGNPWAATRLMELTNGRYGRNCEPTQCHEPWMVDGKCAPPELLPISSARKWAEIAGEGGNAQAQEWLCWAATDGNPDRGQLKDEHQALKWCQLASHNTCSFSSIKRYSDLLRKGVDRAPPNNKEADRIEKWLEQPWRDSLGGFFSPKK